MNKELYVSSTPHETKVGLMEDDQLAEIYYERANEYTLAGSIYKGRVTRVLPGMQSAFVDIGLERDAFLYVSDFLDLQDEEDEEFGEVKVTGQTLAKANGFVVTKPEHGAAEIEEEDDSDVEDSEGSQSAAPAEGGEAQGDDANGRRWRGRRRRRGRRGGRDRFPNGEGEAPKGEGQEAAPDNSNVAFVDEPEEGDEEPVQLDAEQAQEPERNERPRRDNNRRDTRGENRGDNRRDTPREPRRDNSRREPQFREEPVEAASHPTEAVDEVEPMLLPGETRAPRGPRDPEAEAAASAEAPQRSEGFRGGRDRGGRGDRDRGGRGGGRDRGGRFGGRDRDRGGREREPRAREPETPLPTNYQPIVLPGESLSKYRGAAPVEFTEEHQFEQDNAITPADEPATLHEAAAHDEPNFSKAEDHEPTEASAELRGPSIAPFRSENRTPEPQEETPSDEERRRLRDMNLAAIFGGAAVEEETDEHEEIASESHHEEIASQEAHHEPLAEVATEALAHEHHSEPPHEEAREERHRDERPRDEHRQHQQAAAHEEGNYSPSGEGNVVHEEIDEEEADMPSFSDHYNHYHMNELEEETVNGDGDTHITAAGQIGEAVRDTDEERAIEDDEYDFNGDDEFEESEMTADGEGTEVEDEIDEEEDSEEGSEEAPANGEAPAPGRDRQRRPGFDRGRRGGRRDGGDRGRGRMGRGGGGRGPRREPRVIPLISDVLKEGQEILVQIAKEPIGKKGARITSHIALPGRFLVYMPTVNHIGVSRKINSDEERQRLKRIVMSERENGHGGFIVRTAAANIKEDDLRADIRFLKHLWHEIRERSEKSKSPSLIYHDLNLVERVLRDQVTQDFSQIWVDSESEYERVVRFASRFQPNLVRRIKLYTKDTPLYEEFGIQDEINKSLKSKVWLKSGGYIVINQTEALVAIDINTGKYVGKTQRLEDTIVKTNVDAIKEIVRQIRLRDLGGIIVIDFIDMDERRNRQKVMMALEEALKSDRAPSKVLQFNDFGLVAITRKRVKQSLERTLGSPCPYCESTGFVKNTTTVCNEIWVEMRKIRKHVESKEVTLRVNPEVAKELKAEKGKWLTEMEDMLGKPILLKGDPAVHQEQFDLNF